MSIPTGTSDDELIIEVALRLPEDGDPNQDFLFDLAHGMSLEELASRYASGNITSVRSRIAIQYEKLGIPLPFTDPRAMHILRSAFDL